MNALQQIYICSLVFKDNNGDAHITLGQDCKALIIQLETCFHQENAGENKQTPKLQ